MTAWTVYRTLFITGSASNHRFIPHCFYIIYCVIMSLLCSQYHFWNLVSYKTQCLCDVQNWKAEGARVNAPLGNGTATIRKYRPWCKSSTLLTRRLGLGGYSNKAQFLVVKIFTVWSLVVTLFMRHKLLVVTVVETLRPIGPPWWLWSEYFCFQILSIKDTKLFSIIIHNNRMFYILWIFHVFVPHWKNNPHHTSICTPSPISYLACNC